MSEPLTVMISSRSAATSLPASDTDPTPVQLSVTRQEIKSEIESSSIFGHEGGVTVWISEAEGAAAADKDSWITCMDAAADADLVVVIYSGEAGWSVDGQAIGICHAEMSAAMNADPSKVYAISIEEAVDHLEPATSDKEFREYWDLQSVFRETASTAVELRETVERVIGRALVDRVARSKSLPRGDAVGAALNWSRLSYRDRKRELENVTSRALTGDEPADDHGPLKWKSGEEDLVVVVHGIPDSLAISAARELVGQPFLYDHEPDLPADVPGPVHIIACHKNVTESQARRILGFPDALIVKTRFGVYVADEVQRVQLIFLRHCVDPSATREAVKRLKDWLTQTAEAENMIRRARRRRRIVDLMREDDAKE